MTTIDIDQLEDYTEKQILEFLNVEPDKTFQVFIPRIVYKSPKLKPLASQDYLAAAYSGELLSGIADTFSYLVVDPQAPVPFTFIVEVDQLPKLARLLYILVQGYNPDSNEWDEFSLTAQYFYDVAVKRGRKIRCQPLWDFANRLLEK